MKSEDICSEKNEQLIVIVVSDARDKMDYSERHVQRVCLWGRKGGNKMVNYMKIGSPSTALDTGEIKPMTAPYDPRFPNQNQTRHCFAGYLDFQRCKNRHGEQFEACQYFKKVAHAMCPNDWLERWDEQLEQGTFPVNVQ